MSLYRFPTNYVFFKAQLHPLGEQNSLAALFPVGVGVGVGAGAGGALSAAIARTRRSSREALGKQLEELINSGRRPSAGG